MIDWWDVLCELADAGEMSDPNAFSKERTKL